MRVFLTSFWEGRCEPRKRNNRNNLCFTTSQRSADNSRSRRSKCPISIFAKLFGRPVNRRPSSRNPSHCLPPRNPTRRRNRNVPWPHACQGFTDPIELRFCLPHSFLSADCSAPFISSMAPSSFARRQHGRASFCILVRLPQSRKTRRSTMRNPARRDRIHRDHHDLTAATRIAMILLHLVRRPDRLRHQRLATPRRHLLPRAFSRPVPVFYLIS